MGCCMTVRHRENFSGSTLYLLGTIIKLMLNLKIYFYQNLIVSSKVTFNRADDLPPPPKTYYKYCVYTHDANG